MIVARGNAGLIMHIACWWMGHYWHHWHDDSGHHRRCTDCHLHILNGKTQKSEPKMITTLWLDSEYQGLDKGIRFAVRVLHAAGIETCQSCQGGEGHAYDRPSVDLIATGDDAGGFAALAALRKYGLPVAEVLIVWNIENGLPYEKLWRITFFKTMEARADEQPMFISGYRASPIPTPPEGAHE